MEKAKDVLMKIEEGMRLSTPSEPGAGDEKITELLEAETWMLADKAVELGFADGVRDAEKQKQDENVQNVIGMNFAFIMSAVKQMMPSTVVDRIKAKAEAGDS